MSTMIDSRVVEMRFDNKDFEKNVSSTQRSLQSLEKSLRLTESAEGFKNLNSSINNVNLNNLANNVQSLSDRFTTMGIVGMQVIMRLTDAAIDAGKRIASMVLTPIATGGWARAMNIETAKFQLEGLGVAWKDIEEDINYGVQDTAYGLDAAAKVASQLVASNIEVGESMRTALRAVSGVAAMTSSEYENIGDVFTKVAGQGRLMGDDLLRLSARGLNAAATIAKYLGKSEATVRKMVSEGQIDFMTFAKAMDEAFGQHAKDANKTFTGAMSNIRAALSRIGADFATPFIRNSIDILNRFRVAINGVREVTKPFAAEFARAYEVFARYIRTLLSSEGLLVSFKNNTQGIINILKGLGSVISPAAKAFEDVFLPRGTLSGISSFLKTTSEAFKNFTARLTITADTANKLRSVFRGIFAFVDILKMGFSALLQAVAPGVDMFKNLAGNALDLAAALGEYVVSVDNAIRKNQTFVNIFRPVSRIFEFLRAGVSGVVDFIKELAPLLGQALGKLGNTLTNSLRGFHFMDLIRTLSVTTLAKAVTGFLISLSTAIQDIKTNARGIIVSFKAIFVNLNMYLRDLTAQVKAGILMDIAKAVALLAASLLLLSMIDPDKLGSALTMATILIVELISALKVIQGMHKAREGVGGIFDFLDELDFAKISIQLIALSTGMLILSAAAKVLSTIEPTELFKSLAAIAIGFALFYKTLESLASISGKIPKVGASILAMSIGLIAFSAAIKILSTIGFDELITSLGAVALYLYGFVVIMEQLEAKAHTMLAFSGSIAILSAALISFALALKLLSTIDFDGLIIGLGAIGAYLFGFVEAAKYASGAAANLYALSGALAILSVGLLAFSASIKLLSTIDVDSMIASMMAVLVYIRAFVALSNQIAGSVPKMLAFAGALTIVSTALLIMASAFKVMQGIKFDSMVVSFATFIALMKSLAIISSGTFSSVKMLVFAASMTILATSLLIFATAVKALGQIKVEETIEGLIAFGAALFSLVLVASALQTFIPLLISFSGALAAVGIGIGLLSWGLDGFSDFLGALGKGLGGIFGGIRSAFGLMDGSAQDIGASLDNEIATGITNNKDVVVSAAEKVAEEAEVASQWDVPPPDTTVAEEGLSSFEMQMGNTSTEVEAFAESNNEAAQALDNVATEAERATERVEAEARAMANINSSGYISRRDARYLGDYNSEYELARNAGSFLRNNDLGHWNKYHSSIRRGTEDLEEYAAGLRTVQHYTTIAETEFRTYADVLNAVGEANDELQERLGPSYAEFVQQHGELTAKMVTGLSEYQIEALKTADAMSEMEERLGPNEFAIQMERQGAEARALAAAYDELERRLGPNGAQEYLRACAESNGALAESLLTAEERLRNLGWTADQIDETFNTVSEVIKNQIGVFEEFSTGAEISAQKVLENMQSQIDGVTQWADNMSTIAQRLGELDLSSGIYEQLAQMGPQGAAYAQAFVSMTDEELQKATELFENIQLLPDNATEQVMNGFADIAQGANQGFSDNLDTQAFYDAGMEGGQNAIDGAAEGAGTHSPSWKTKEIAMNCVKGFQIGFQTYRSLAINAARQLATGIISTLADEMPISKFEGFGRNVGQGLINGMNSMLDAVRNSAANLGRTAAQATQNALQVYSPSRLTTWMGEMFGLGLVGGIKSYNANVKNAAEGLGSEAVKGLNRSVDYIYEVINDNMDLNPVIKPVLDLSNVNAGINTIDSMFNARRSIETSKTYHNGEAGTNAQNLGGVVYNQYNYSPKALSRSEIYRQTKNQLSRAKPAMAGG